MKEPISYQQQFRQSVTNALADFMAINPMLEQSNPLHYQKTLTIVHLMNDTKITPMILWSKINDIQYQLPRPFYHLFQNRLSDLLLALLKQYPIHLLSLYFTQEQYESTQRNEAAYSIEVSALRSQTRSLQQQLTQFTERLELLSQENQELAEHNQQLVEENTQLKAQLEQVLASSENHDQVAASFRQSLTEEITQLRETEQRYKSMLASLLQEKEDLFETCQQLNVENSNLKEKNKRLVDINTRLLKEKLDLTKLQQHSESRQEMTLETRAGFGFFRK